MRHKDELVKALHIFLHDEEIRKHFDMQSWKSCLFFYYNERYKVVDKINIETCSSVIMNHFEISYADLSAMFFFVDNVQTTDLDFYVHRALRYLDNLI